MAWFLRAVESEDGRWSCRWGRREYDSHQRLEEAVSHLREIARGVGDVRYFLHHRSGAVTELGPRSEI